MALLLLACLASSYSYLASPVEQPSARPFAVPCEASVASCWAFVVLRHLASVEGRLVPRMLAFAYEFVFVLVLVVAGRSCLGIGLGLVGLA